MTNGMADEGTMGVASLLEASVVIMSLGPCWFSNKAGLGGKGGGGKRAAMGSSSSSSS